MLLDVGVSSTKISDEDYEDPSDAFLLYTDDNFDELDNVLDDFLDDTYNETSLNCNGDVSKIAINDILQEMRLHSPIENDFLSDLFGDEPSNIFCQIGNNDPKADGNNYDNIINQSYAFQDHNAEALSSDNDLLDSLLNDVSCGPPDVQMEFNDGVQFQYDVMDQFNGDPDVTLPYNESDITLPIPEPNIALSIPEPNNTLLIPETNITLPIPGPNNTLPVPEPNITLPIPEPRNTLPLPEPNITLQFPKPESTTLSIEDNSGLHFDFKTIDNCDRKNEVKYNREPVLNQLKLVTNSQNFPCSTTLPMTPNELLEDIQSYLDTEQDYSFASFYEYANMINGTSDAQPDNTYKSPYNSDLLQEYINEQNQLIQTLEPINPINLIETPNVPVPEAEQSPTIYQCPNCPFFSYTYHGLCVHKRVHAPVPLSYTDCQFATARPDLRQHQAYGHGGVFYCQFCSFVTNSSARIRTHMRYEH